jgi:hypothetical protein
MKYAYTLFLKFSVRYIHPNYLFYSFKCVRRVCPNLSSAPCRDRERIESERLRIRNQKSQRESRRAGRKKKLRTENTARIVKRTIEGRQRRQEGKKVARRKEGSKESRRQGRKKGKE